MQLLPLRHVLHVEDEILIALDVEASLLNAGVKSVTHVGTCFDAQMAIETSRPDAVILDMRVLDGSTAGLAELLRSLAIPFVIYSGSVDSGLSRSFEGAKFLEKPSTEADLIDAVKELVATPSSC